MLTIQLSAEVERKLETLAHATGQPASFHAEQAITEYLGDLEDYRAAERELEDVRSGRSIPVSLDDLLTSHGVAG